MNRWSAGENHFGGADWSASWTNTTVSDDDWRSLRAQLRSEAERWLVVLRTPREVQEQELNGMIGSIAHPGVSPRRHPADRSHAARSPRSEPRRFWTMSFVDALTRRTCH